MDEQSNDVTKALAAFGAPSIRYHSFSHTAVRPSSVVLPQRATAPVAEPVQVVPPPEDEAVPLPMESTMAAAPSPRPLAEWVGPLTSAPEPEEYRPVRQAVPPPVVPPLAPPPSMASPAPSPGIPPRELRAPQVNVPPASQPVRSGVPRIGPGIAPSAATRTLPELFAFLAGS